jgi:hypothetical protein
MVRMFTDNLTGDTVCCREQFNPWGSDRIWVEIGRCSAVESTIQQLVDLTVRGRTAEQEYVKIREEIDAYDL